MCEQGCNSVKCLGMCAKLLQSCLTVCDPMDRNPSGSSVHGIIPERIPVWVAMPSSRGASWPRDWTHVSYTPALTGGFFPPSVTWEAQLRMAYFSSYLLGGLHWQCWKRFLINYCTDENPSSLQSLLWYHPSGAWEYFCYLIATQKVWKSRFPTGLLQLWVQMGLHFFLGSVTGIAQYWVNNFCMVIILLPSHLAGKSSLLLGSSFQVI